MANLSQAYRVDENTPWFKLTSKKIEVPDYLAKEVAGIVIQWSAFEAAIVHDLTMLRRHRNAKVLAETIPLNFVRKIELWKRSIVAVYPYIRDYQDVAADTTYAAPARSMPAIAMKSCIGTGPRPISPAYSISSRIEILPYSSSSKPSI